MLSGMIPSYVIISITNVEKHTDYEDLTVH